MKTNRRHKHTHTHRDGERETRTENEWKRCEFSTHKSRNDVKSFHKHKFRFGYKALYSKSKNENMYCIQKSFLRGRLNVGITTTTALTEAKDTGNQTEVEARERVSEREKWYEKKN